MQQISLVDLNQFCADEAYRGLNEPFSVGGFTYACNGHMLLRVARINAVDREKPDVVKLEKLPLDYKGARYIEIPVYQEPEKTKCSSCKGTGYASTCYECDGEGYVDLSSEYHDYEVECKTCFGDGSIPGGESKCTSCGGTGTVYMERYTLAHDYGNGWGISAQVLDKIKNLPGVKINDHNLDGVVPFTFLGGQGVLMCMATD